MELIKKLSSHQPKAKRDTNKQEHHISDTSRPSSSADQTKQDSNQNVSSNQVNKLTFEENKSKPIDKRLESDLETISQISEYLRKTESNYEQMGKYSQIIESEQFNEAELFDVKSFEDLPIEILCKIFDYLDFDERKRVSTVCKKWRNAFLDSFSVNNVIIKVNNNLFKSNRPMTSSQSSLSLKEPTKSFQTISNIQTNRHRSASQLALASYSINGVDDYKFYSNMVNLEFLNDSADVDLLLKVLRMHNYNKQQFENYENTGKSNLPLLGKLKTIKFMKTNLSSKSLIEMLNETPNLTSLSLVHCDSLFMSGFLANLSNNNLKFNLTHLTELSLSRNRYLSDYLINLFLSSTPSLNSLDISYCSLTKSNYKSVKGLSLTSNLSGDSEEKGSSVVLTIENLVNKLKKFNLHLKAINLSGIDLFNHEEDSLISLLECMPTLENVNLSNLPFLKADVINKAFRKVSKLVSVDLSGSIQCDDDSKKPGIETCLQTIVENGSSNIYDGTISPSPIYTLKLNKAKINNSELFRKQFVQLKNLVHLDMSCSMFQQGFANKTRLNEFIENFGKNLAECVHMEHLSVNYCEFLVNDLFIKTIAKSLRKLKHLDLRNCTQITDKSLHYIAFYLSNLVHLDVSWCQNLSDYGLNRSLEYGKNKQLLNEFNKHLNGSCRCMRKYTEQPFLMIKTKQDLKTEMNKQFFSCVGSSSLNSSSSDTLPVEEEEEVLVEDLSLKNLRKLKILRMEACVNISDIGLANGLELSQLHELDIKLCTNITGDFILNTIQCQENNQNINAEINRRSLKLKVLNLNQCLKFKEQNLLAIVESSPDLHELSVSAISNISNKLIECLLHLKKFLHVLDVSFCSYINESIVDKYEHFIINDFGSSEFHLDKRFIKK
jgi:hypothetical protein